MTEKAEFLIFAVILLIAVVVLCYISIDDLVSFIVKMICHNFSFPVSYSVLLL